MNNPFLQRLKAQPTLVQRIARFTPQPDAHRTGIDAYFGFDYMGASEFEWGTLPAALKCWQCTRAPVSSASRMLRATIISSPAAGQPRKPSTMFQ